MHSQFHCTYAEAVAHAVCNHDRHVNRVGAYPARLWVYAVDAQRRQQLGNVQMCAQLCVGKGATSRLQEERQKATCTLESAVGAVDSTPPTRMLSRERRISMVEYG